MSWDRPQSFRHTKMSINVTPCNPQIFLAFFLRSLRVSGFLVLTLSAPPGRAHVILAADNQRRSMSFSRSFVSGVLVGILTLGVATAQVTTVDPAVEKKIQRIQDGLLPAVVVKGVTAQPSKLADRMAAVRVPGVSIA